MTTNKIMDTIYIDSTTTSKEITLESLYNEIEIIKDTLASVATNTEPSTFLWVDSSISNNTIGLIAAIFGIAATIFGYLGYKYQKISSEELKKMIPVRAPLLPIVKKLYDNYIMLRLIYGDTKYTPQEQSEDEFDPEYKHLYFDEIIQSFELPTDIFDLSKFEKYNDKEIYDFAVKLKLRWNEYNQALKITIQELKDDYIGEVSFQNISDLTESLAYYIFEFDDLVNQVESKQYNTPYIPNQLEINFKEDIIILFINSIDYLRYNNPSNFDIINQNDTDASFCSLTNNNSNNITINNLRQRTPLSKYRDYLTQPKSIKTYLEQPNINSALATIEELHNQINSSDQSQKKLLNSLTDIFGEYLVNVLNKFHTSREVNYDDIVGYDIALRISKLKVDYIEWEQLYSEISRIRYYQNQ